jgi:Carboxypeptidase regulatory-like domain
MECGGPPSPFSKVVGVMSKKLGFLAAVLALVLPAWSAVGSGTISGYVRDSRGVPQMGAAVEVLPQFGAQLVQPATQAIKAFTNDRGFFSLPQLLPGTYNLKVSEPSFLPTLRESVRVHAGGKMMVNVTLTNLFEAIQLISTPAQSDPDDWKWTLRSIANRPVLRALPDGTTAVIENGTDDLKGSLALVAGSPSEGFSTASDMNAVFSVERSVSSSGTLRVRGNLGYDADGSGAIPTAVLRTTYTTQYSGMFEPSVSLTALRLNSPDINTMPGATLQALSLTSSDRIVVGDRFELRLGSELQTIQFLGRVHAFKPFGSADIHLSPNTVVEYQYRSSVPRNGIDDTTDTGLDPASPDPGATGPRMSIVNFIPAVERAHHQEVSISQRIGKNNMQLGYYADSMEDPVLTGLGDLSTESGEVIPDIYSGTFNYQGNDFNSRGVRLVLQRKLLSDLTATLDYAYGNVLDLSHPDVQLQDAREYIRTERRQAVAAKLSGTIPKARTHWVASYRFADGRGLTPVDIFNTSPGQADPYLNLFIRQPIPSSLLAGHLELLIDLHNLLAQGYVPVIGQDGHTVYLVQSARAVRGGLAFNF